MNVTLTINGVDFHDALSTYNVSEEITYRSVLTTLDDVEHPYPSTRKLILSFSLLPRTDEECTELYRAVAEDSFTVRFTNPYGGTEDTREMRVVSDLESTFALLSVDGKRRYKGGIVQLREL